MSLKKFATAASESSSEDRGPAIEYELDGREMKAYRPHDGQLTFMMAALGRGQTDQQRYSAIVNIMMASHQGDDQDHLESRLLANKWSERLHLPQLEEIFEYLISEWFADPTREQSGSAESEQIVSQKSQPPTT